MENPIMAPIAGKVTKSKVAVETGSEPVTM